MTISTTIERRALNKDEFALVEKTHHPVIQQLSAKELSETITQLRRLRNKYRDTSRTQVREKSGKSQSHSTRRTVTVESERFKKQIFANALSRANNQRDRLEPADDE